MESFYEHVTATRLWLLLISGGMFGASFAFVFSRLNRGSYEVNKADLPALRGIASTLVSLGVQFGFGFVGALSIVTAGLLGGLGVMALMLAIGFALRAWAGRRRSRALDRLKVVTLEIPPLRRLFSKKGL